MTDLAKKDCVPCKGDVSPLSAEQARAMLAHTPGWTLEGKHISRRFEFGNFDEALALVKKVGALAQKQDHHPDISFGWGYASFSLETHSIGGLHENDFIMAAHINALA